MEGGIGAENYTRNSETGSCHGETNETSAVQLPSAQDPSGGDARFVIVKWHLHP